MAKKAKLPTDVNARAKAIVDFATSDEELPEKDEAKAEGGRKGAASRAANLTAEERSEIARKAAQTRWSDG